MSKRVLARQWRLELLIDRLQLFFEGRIEFREIICSVPINSAQPLEWARQLARRELALEQFGQCTLIDADHTAGKYKTTDGISETGRLVVLQMPVG